MTNKINVLIRWILILGSIILTISLCSIPIFAFLYPAYPWPSPKVYPNAKSTYQEGSIGSWGIARHQSYQVNLPMESIQQHYKHEMEQYCVDDWQFEQLSKDKQFSASNKWNLPELPNYVENSVCYQTECKIHRLWLAQEFNALICAKNETETVIVHIDLWED